MNIPIFRAKKIDSDEYVIGFYSSAYDIHHYVITHLGVDTKTSTVYQMSTDIHKIDSTTLAIHFPDMLDSQGNKIFASLSKDGKGGDIIEWTIFPSDTQQQRIKGTPYYSGHSVFKITNRMEMMWHSLAPHRKSKIIGIQE